MKIKRISNVLLLVLAMIMSVWGTHATKVDADGSGALNPWVYTWKNLEKYKTPIEGQTYVEAGLHVYTVRELEVENYVPTYNQNFTVKDENEGENLSDEDQKEEKYEVKAEDNFEEKNPKEKVSEDDSIEDFFRPDPLDRMDKANRR